MNGWTFQNVRKIKVYLCIATSQISFYADVVLASCQILFQAI